MFWGKFCFDGQSCVCLDLGFGWTLHINDARTAGGSWIISSGLILAIECGVLAEQSELDRVIITDWEGRNAASGFDRLLIDAFWGQRRVTLFSCTLK